ncbi:LysM domain-containing protein, partial [Ilyonectria robusta]|uniref:LysM domain-containing protein n=1 Tax=Ilyonectria robusta TaxID=1079257 RepID=UPI001E8D725C
LDEEILDSMCMMSCRQSLVDLRLKIQLACEMDKRPFVYKHIEFPPTYRADLLLLSYDTYCYKDKDTGKLCDLQLAEWRATPPKTPIECNDCILGPWKLQLEAPIGYKEDDASDFSTSTSSCGVTGYEYSKPTQYATTNTKRLSMEWEKFRRPTPTPCLSPYIIKEDDDCESIARENSVSAHKLRAENYLDLRCHKLPSPGASICLPPKCKTHEVEYGDTCTGLSDQYGVSSQQLISWNPIFDEKCSNIRRWSGTSICVGYIAPPFHGPEIL